MGRTTTPTFRVEMTTVRLRDGQRFGFQLGWEKQYGRPTGEALARFVKDFDQATAPGGVNAHLGQEQTTQAKVVRQATQEVVAEFVRPMFEAVV